MNLLDAIESSNVAEVQQILSNHEIDVNIALTNGKEKKTALYLAVEKGNIEIIQILLSNPAIDVNQKTILELPAEETNNYYYGENADEPNTFGMQGGYHAKMDTEEKANFCDNHNNTMEITPLYLAISKENQEIIQMLLSHPNIDVNLITIRKYCALRGKEDRDEMKNTYWNTQKKAPIHFAIEKKNKEIVQMLLNHPQIDINAPYLYESGYNYLEKYSIKKSPICVAIDVDCFDIFQMLINHHGVDVSYKIVEEEYNEARKTYISEYNLLHLAAKKGNPNIIKILLKQPDIDVNALFISQRNEKIIKTALSIAIENDNIEAIRILLLNPKIRTDIKIFDAKYKYYYLYIKEEATPLYKAVQKRNKEIVRLLLSKPETDVNEPCKYSHRRFDLFIREITQIKNAPLDVAVENEDTEIIELLLTRENINVNILSEYKYNCTIIDGDKESYEEIIKNTSPLFVAVEKENQKIVENLLLRSNINLNLISTIKKDNNITKKTSIELAREKGNEKILNLLEN